MRVLIAIGVSVFVHLILAAGLWWYFAETSAPVVLAQLDLTSVELSLADEDVEQAVPVAALASAPSREQAKKAEKVPDEKAPEAERVDPAIPDLAEPEMPEVRPEAPALPEVKVVKKPEAKKPEVKRPEAKEPTPAIPEVAPKQAKVDAPPSLKRAIRPDYPRGSRLRKEEGDVSLEIRVTASGEVDDVRLVASSGFAELDEAAVRAAKAARFTPAKSGRESVASVARLKLTFRLK